MSRVTVTRNVQFVRWPAVSLAVQRTVLVPTGNTKPDVTGTPVIDASEQLMVRLVKQRFVPVMLKFAGAPLEQVVRRMSEGQSSTIHGQHVAVAVISTRRPLGPTGRAAAFVT